MRDDVAKVLKMFQIPTFGNKKKYWKRWKVITYRWTSFIYISNQLYYIFAKHKKKRKVTGNSNPYHQEIYI